MASATNSTDEPVSYYYDVSSFLRLNSEKIGVREAQLHLGGEVYSNPPSQEFVYA